MKKLTLAALLLAPALACAQAAPDAAPSYEDDFEPPIVEMAPPAPHVDPIMTYEAEEYAAEEPTMLPVNTRIVGEDRVVNRIVSTGRDWSTVEIWMGTAVMCFMTFVLLLLVFLIRSTNSDWSPEEVLRAVGLIIVVGLAVVLVAVGYSAQQTSPVMGLLGMIIGYLLKKDAEHDKR